MRVVARLLGTCLLMLGGVAAAPRSVAGDGWDYIYGDPGPENFSRYQEVEISPTGGYFLAGFFSGTFEGFTTPGAVYQRFVQYKDATGATQWTKLLKDGNTVAVYSVVPRAPVIDVDGDGVAYIETCEFLNPVNCSLRSIDNVGTELGARPVVSGYAAGISTSRAALRAGGLVKVNVTGGSFPGPVTADVELMDASLNEVWTYDSQPRSADLPAVAEAPDGAIWVVGSNPRPLPTLASNVTMIKLAASTGAEVLTVKQLGRRGGAGLAGQETRVLMVNDQTLWIKTIKDTESLAGIESFSAIDGSLRGTVTMTGDANVQFIHTGEVLSGGQRLLVTEGNGAPGRLRMFSLEGDPQVVATLLFDQAVAGGIYAVDSDELGNYVVAGSTTDSLVFGSRSESSPGAVRGEATFSVEKGFVSLNGAGRIGLKVSPALPLRVKMTGRNGVPASGVGAVSLNVTVTSPDGGGFVTVYPCGGRPDASNLNFVAGQTVPNAVIAPVSAEGEVCFFSDSKTHLIADVNGYFPAGSGFTPSSPARLFDTRVGAAQGLRSVNKAKIGGAVELRVKVTDLPGYVPASGVSAVSLNVTVTGPEAGGYVTVYPCGGRPDASNLNFVAGQTVPNAVIAPVSPAGEVCFFSDAPTDLIADVNGYFPAGNGFVGVTPLRVFDTRAGSAQGARAWVRSGWLCRESTCSQQSSFSRNGRAFAWAPGPRIWSGNAAVSSSRDWSPDGRRAVALADGWAPTQSSAQGVVSSAAAPVRSAISGAVAPCRRSPQG